MSRFIVEYTEYSGHAVFVYDTQELKIVARAPFESNHEAEALCDKLNQEHTKW